MKKLSIIMLITVLVLTFIITNGCKKDFDIRGTWEVNGTAVSIKAGLQSSTVQVERKLNSRGVWNETWIFSGDLLAGTVIADAKWTGSYTVNDESIVVSWSDNDAVFNGTATDDDNITGTMAGSFVSGTWTAVRTQ